MRKKNRPSSRMGSLLPKKRGERRRAELWAAGAAGLLVVSIFLVSSLDKLLIGSQQYAAVIAAVLVDLANTDRTSQDVGALTVNPLLVEAAQAKADDMAKYSYFAHVSPQGVDPWHWFQLVGYKFDYAGENLAVDFSDSNDVNTAWMNSPTHRANILDPHYTEIGIATSQGMYEGHPTTFVVQEFGRPSSSAGAIVSQTIPENPTSLAVASATTSAVLGEAVQTTQKPAPAKPKPVVAVATPQKPAAAAASTPVPATLPPAAAPAYAPWWAYLVASPHSFLEYAYWVLGLLIVLLLGFATGFEVHIRHTRKALTAGALLAFMCLILVIASTFVFTAPTLTPQAVQTAAAGAAF